MMGVIYQPVNAHFFNTPMFPIHERVHVVPWSIYLFCPTFSPRDVPLPPQGRHLPSLRAAPSLPPFLPRVVFLHPLGCRPPPTPRLPPHSPGYTLPHRLSPEMLWQTSYITLLSLCIITVSQVRQCIFFISLRDLSRILYGFPCCITHIFYILYLCYCDWCVTAACWHRPGYGPYPDL